MSMDKYLVLYNPLSNNKRGEEETKKIEQLIPEAEFTYGDMEDITDMEGITDTEDITVTAPAVALEVFLFIVSCSSFLCFFE